MQWYVPTKLAEYTDAEDRTECRDLIDRTDISGAPRSRDVAREHRESSGSPTEWRLRNGVLRDRTDVSPRLLAERLREELR